MQDQLETGSNRIANNLYVRLCEFMSQGWTERELIDLQQSIKVYNASLLSCEQGLVSNYVIS